MMRARQFPRLLIFAALLASVAAVVACGENRPPAHAHSWAPVFTQARRHVHSTIAAAIVATAPAPRVESSVRVPAPVKRAARPAIRLFTADGADCPTEALGVVNERAYGDADETAALARLKEKARAMGADAIVGYRTAAGAAAGTDLAGVAVRCERLAENRPYDTIDRLEVPVTPGAEQEAFDELLARADKLHANLVTGVQLVPDASGVGQKVVGAAIRYR